MMPRRSLSFILPLALLTLAACADKGAEQPGSGDSTTAAVIEVPTTPMVTAIEIGRALDDSNRVLGSGVEHFPSADTLYVKVTTSHVVAGTPLTVRLTRGTTLIDSVDVPSGPIDAESNASAIATLPKAHGVTAGAYRIEVLLDGASQGVREFTIDG
jgi:hypothetical protein